jgi:hypothetical protein
LLYKGSFGGEVFNVDDRTYKSRKPRKNEAEDYRIGIVRCGG